MPFQKTQIQFPTPLTAGDLAPSEFKHAGNTLTDKTNLLVSVLAHSWLLKYKDKTQLPLTVSIWHVVYIVYLLNNHKEDS